MCDNLKWDIIFQGVAFLRCEWLEEPQNAGKVASSKNGQPSIDKNEKN